MSVKKIKVAKSENPGSDENVPLNTSENPDIPVETPDFPNMAKNENEEPEKPLKKRYKKKADKEKEKAADFEKTIMDVKGLFQLANGFLLSRQMYKWLFSEHEIDSGAPIVGRLIEKYLPSFGKYADETAFAVFIGSYFGTRLMIQGDKKNEEK